MKGNKMSDMYKTRLELEMEADLLQNEIETAIKKPLLPRADDLPEKLTRLLQLKDELTKREVA